MTPPPAPASDPAATPEPPGPAADPQPARQLTLTGKASTPNEHPPLPPGGLAAGQEHTPGGRR
jgi:hypothetical protein